MIPSPFFYCAAAGQTSRAPVHGHASLLCYQAASQPVVTAFDNNVWVATMFDAAR
jgi:hypothetical protein